MSNVLSCFFPTTVVLIDDSKSFLDTLVETFCFNNTIFKKFSNPIDAIEFINSTANTNKLDVSDIISIGEESTSDWQSLMVSVNRLHREIYNPERFSRISTVIADYAMPAMNGVDLCSHIKDKSIQKILLTGVADERIAINAFNEGCINQFIKKGANNFEDDVQACINRCVCQYFNLYTEDLSKHLSANDRAHLKDPIFANFFFNTCLNKTFVEYYMLDNFGSYMFLNQKGQASLLSVLTEYEIQRIIDVGVESGEISQDVEEGLKSREYMLVYHNRAGILPPINKWGNYLKPARRLEGYQTYYFAFADSSVLDIDIDKIYSFERFQSRE